MLPSLKKRLVALLIGIGAGLCAVIILRFLIMIPFIKDTIDLLDGFFYDKLFSPNNTPTNSLVIVDMKTPSDIVDRGKCAELIERLQTAKAKVIGFDIRFNKRLGQAGDDWLVKVSRNYKNVIHVYKLTPSEEMNNEQLEAELITKHALKNLKIMPPPYFDKRDLYKSVEFPFPDLFYAAQNLAHVNFEADNAFGDRRFPLIIRYGNEIYPGLALQMVRRYLNIRDENFGIHLFGYDTLETHADNFISLIVPYSSTYKIPVNDLGQVLVNYIEFEKFTRYSINEALVLLKKIAENPYSKNPFKHKMVLVVNSSSEDDLSTNNPLGDPSLPYCVIHASIISQILNDKHITESPLSLIFFSFIGVLLLLSWLIFIEVRIKWLKNRSWLILIIAVLLLLISAGIRLHSGNWPNVIVAAIVLCASYLLPKNYIGKIPTIPIPYYHDFELQVQEKAGSTYLVDVIKSPAGEEAVGEFTLDLKKLMAMVRKFQETFNPPREKVRNFGKTLFNAIFQEKTKRRYDESLGKIKRSGDRLRIKLRIEPPELSLLPWEFLYDPERRSHLVLSKELSIVRYLLIPQEIEPLEVAPPLKILILISAPSDCTPLQVKNELIKITKALKKLKRRRQIKLDILDKVTVEEFRARIHNYHVIHYIGHGGFVERGNEEIGCLFFENEAGTSELVDAEQLGLLLGNSPVRLVVLNACETAKTSTYDAFLGVAPTLVNAGIPAVIAMQYPIADTSAVIFSEEFYRSLSINYQVDAAMTDAKIAMAARIGVNRTDWSIPVLFMRSPDGVLFRPKS
jgi:CHASE2 domain-containing sensor protein